ncbi:hypothetical protein A1O3_00600 [Capronia epimyces CBS 606.96]|uniref:Uncharacterized protein n=1 Tax=Capronia epimyces CBS 606.96 TaxID=1182542 RepID=W9YQV9_9EURO|nr:uncharacterized protein A1O3_00600 [Capronia epimyces CBS 606.96]EXJ92050.1 hypothetical protein A1O3_00600 [Capronia epimyces CBS 606.96]
MSKRGRGGASGNKLKMTLGLPVPILSNISACFLQPPKSKYPVNPQMRRKHLYFAISAQKDPGLMETKKPNWKWKANG